ncbi:NAD-dependent epimerase/dehydratase family protein [Thalassiella azotivora]
MTGATGPAGRAVTAALAAAVGHGLRRVVAVVPPAPAPDDHPGDVLPDDVAAVAADTASPTVVRALEGADVVVHVACPDDLEAALAVDHPTRRARVVRSAQAVLTAAAAVGARHVVVVGSAMVHGARPDAPVPLADDAPLLAEPDTGVVGDLLEVEQVVARARTAHPALTVTAVRPAALVGPGVDTLSTRHFEAPRLLSVREARTAWQFCHVADLGAAVLRVVLDGIDGDVGVGAPGALSADDVERLSGMRRVDLPAALAFGTAERLHRVGVLPMPATDLAYVVHPWVVSAQRLREAGWRPAHDNEQCLRELLEHVAGHHAVAARRLERRDAALGAAGAAVALVGTAAVWRQARVRAGRRRGGRA